MTTPLPTEEATAAAAPSTAEATAALHAEVAAKLRRAKEKEGDPKTTVGPKRSRNKSASSSGGSMDASGGSSSSSSSRGTGTGGGGRKLLHWTAPQWQAFEAAPQFAKLVAPAKMLPIRAPLSSIYEIHFADAQANYAPSALMEKLLAASRSGPVINVGLVIDATGSDGFVHDPREWDDWDVKYTKLSIILPDDATEEGQKARATAEDAMATLFFERVEKHKSGENKDMDIAVFGAGVAGYNLVGYLIVRYLIEYCELGLAAALQEYATAAPPGVYSRNHLERLFRKYFATLPSSASTVKCPAPPAWDPTASSSEAGKKIGADILTDEDREHKFVCKARPRKQTAVAPTEVSSGTTSSFGSGSMGSSGTPTSGSSMPPAPTYKPPLYIPRDRDAFASRPTKRRKIRSWVDDVQQLEYGDLVDPQSEEHEKIRKGIEKLTGIEGFPGCEAIPLTATHVASEAFKKRGCLTQNYLVTWRARGRRCLLYVADSGIYVVSRDMSFTKVDMKIPRRRAPTEGQTNTLLDGIIVEDQDHGHKVARYLAFDVLFLEGSPIWQKKLEKRLQCLQNEVILPRKNDQTFDYTKEPFRMRMKDHFRLAKAEFLLTKFVKDVTHDVEGVIFTPTEAPYNLGGFETEDSIFKFVASGDGGIPGLDGSITQKRLLQYIQTIPSK